MIRRIIPYQIWKRSLHDSKLPSIKPSTKFRKTVIGTKSPRKADFCKKSEKEKRFIKDIQLENDKSNRKL